MMMREKGYTGLLLLVVLVTAGCATVNTRHPEVLTNAELKETPDAKYATVYFIRPWLFKSKGAADKPVRVEYQDKLLLKIDEGSYTLLRIKPGKGDVKTFSFTRFINQSEPIEVWRVRRYKFIAGKTYLILLHRIDEEFRGVFYEPEPITLKQAKVLLERERIRSSGAARRAPIDKLTDIKPPPTSAAQPLPPALPEQIYKQEKYLRKID
jgi:hypothetical protein